MLLRSNKVVLVKNMKLVRTSTNRICYYGYNEEYLEPLNSRKVKEFKKKAINSKILRSLSKQLHKMNHNHLLIDYEVLHSTNATLPLYMYSIYIN